MKKSLRECYINYFGAGNPEANYWFIGFEPGLDEDLANYINNNNLKEMSDLELVNHFQAFGKEKVGQGVYRQLFYLLKELRLEKNYSSTSNDRFISFPSNGDAFFTNLFLLKFINETEKSNIDNLKKYQEIFNLDSDIIKISEYCKYLDRLNLYNIKWIIERSNKHFQRYINPSIKKYVFILKKNYNYLYYLLLGIDAKYISPIPNKFSCSKCELYTSSMHYNLNLIFLKNGIFSKECLENIFKFFNIPK